MAEQLLSVGLDVGTTTTQLVVSRLTAENRASAFAVPNMEITGREILYQSPIRFTPLIRGELVDGGGIREIVAAEYEKAGIVPSQVDTGAVIITGETSRKENAAAVLAALSDYAGEFVVATAGPDLESVLAAKGAGAVDFSADTGKRVLHMDIGGGTSNLALVEDGHIAATGCLNVGGRLIKLTETGRITYISPVLENLVPHRVGDSLNRAQAMEVAALLVSVLEMAAGLREKTELFAHFTTGGTTPIAQAEGAVLSFSGGVADCIRQSPPWLSYGDLGPCLGEAIRESRLCRGEYRLGSQTIRATVIGAGCHSVQLSGSTVYLQNVVLPLKNLPVVAIRETDTAEAIAQRLSGLDGPGVLALPGWENPAYSRITALADTLAAAAGGKPLYVALEGDMAKALGHALALRLPEGSPCLCIDRVRPGADSYLDIGRAVGPAIRLVIKTLMFESQTQGGRL